MEEIDQVAALLTKFLLHLIGYPRRTIANPMNRGACAKSGLDRTVKEALPGRANIALQRATKGQCLAPLRVCKTYFRLFPVALFTFALVGLGRINLYDGYHASVCLDDNCGAGARLCGPTPRWRGCLKYLSGMTLGDARYSAFTQYNAIVLNEFVHGLGKGLVSTEVGDYAL